MPQSGKKLRDFLKKNQVKGELTISAERLFGALPQEERGDLSEMGRVRPVSQNNCLTWLSVWLGSLPINFLNYDKMGFEFESFHNPLRHLSVKVKWEAP